MTALVITATSIIPVANAHTVISQTGDLAGETITQGMMVLKVSGKWMKADSNDTAALAEASGMAVNAASLNQPITVVIGDVDMGSILTIGEFYILSATAGAIEPVGDQGTSVYATLVGGALSATRMRVRPFALGVLTPSGG